MDIKVFKNHRSRPMGAPVGVRGRHSVSLTVRVARALRHSGRVVLLACLVNGAAWSQETPLWLDLRSGKELVATSLTGSQERGFVAVTSRGNQRVAPHELLAVRLAAARAPKLLRVELAGGELVHGAIAGGDQDGDALELLSPAFGQIAISIDRITALVQPGIHASDQVLPDGVDEALFLPTARGFDLIAGTLHRFGSQGVSFQPSVSEDPQWYSPQKLSAVRLRGAIDRARAASMTLLTRSADRLGVNLKACDGEGLDVVLENGSTLRMPWSDVACLVFEKDVVHLSALTPTQVVESGFDGEVVHPWCRDACVAGGELLVQGRAFGRGIGAHSRSRLSFRVPEGATHFRARVAFDDSVSELPVRAHAVVRVLHGNKVVLEVRDLVPGSAPHDVGLHAVKAGDSITLEVDFGRGRDIGDRVDWLLPMFLMRSQS